MEVAVNLNMSLPLQRPNSIAGLVSFLFSPHFCALLVIFRESARLDTWPCIDQTVLMKVGFFGENLLAYMMGVFKYCSVKLGNINVNAHL